MRETATLSALLAAACLATAGCVTTSPSGLAGTAQQEPAAERRQTASVGQEVPAPARQSVAAPPAPAAAAPAGPPPDAVIKLNPGSEKLAPEMEARLAKVAEAARRDERVMLRLESYVPDGGSPSVNLLRAEQSVQLVRKRLVDMAVNPRRIVMAPFGGEYTTARDERRHWVEIYLIRPRL